jgi:hypothetical protein
MQPASGCSSWLHLTDLIRRPHLYKERKGGPARAKEGTSVYNLCSFPSQEGTSGPMSFGCAMLVAAAGRAAAKDMIELGSRIL